MNSTTKTTAARGRVRNDVQAYFVDFSGHGAIDDGAIADGTMHAADHAEAFLETQPEGYVAEAAEPGLTEEDILWAIEAECALTIEQCIANVDEMEKASA